MRCHLMRAILPAAARLGMALVLLTLPVLAFPPAHAGPTDHLNPRKPPPPPLPARPPSAVALPGETFANAIPVTMLPFEATGNTCAYANDYAVMCPYGNWAPDVVYALTPTEETNIRIELCDSLYDTLMFLYVIDSQWHHLLGCNDDSCGDDGYKSSLDRIHVAPGFTYYIVVDGYTSACGDYVLRVLDLGSCIPECTALWQPEGEPVCGDGYHDEFDAGCGAYPNVFRAVEPSTHIIRICGTSGWFWTDGFLRSDQDWYEIQVEQANQVDVFCQAEFDVSLYLYDGNHGCGQVMTLDQDEGLWCDNLAQVSAQLDPGTYWIVVEPESGSGGCGLGYRLWIDGYVPAATAVGETGAVAGIQLRSVAPNPFRATTTISYELAHGGTVHLAIHDVSGRLVRTLVAQNAAAGPGSVAWDGQDDHGRPVASGIYECRLTCGTATDVRPIIRVR